MTYTPKSSKDSSTQDSPEKLGGEELKNIKSGT